MSPTTASSFHVDDPWFDRTLFPLESRFLDLPAGRVHSVDEDKGRALAAALEGFLVTLYSRSSSVVFFERPTNSSKSSPSASAVSFFTL